MSDESAELRTRIIGPLFKSQAEELYEQGQIAQALDAFRDQAEHQDGFFRAHLGLGKCLMALGQPGQAIVPLQKARRLAPDDLEVATVLASAHVAQGAYHEALSLLEPFCASGAASARAYFLVGLCFEYLQELMDAGRAYGQALQIDPSHKDAAQHLGGVLDRLSDIQGGDPQQHTIVKELDIGVLRKDQRTLAMGLLDRQSELRGTRVDIGLEPGERLGQDAMFTRVIEGYGKAVEETPDYEDVWAGLAMAYAARGELRLAQQHICRAIAINPRRSDFQMLRGDLLMHLGDFSQALEAFSIVIDQEKDDPEAHFSAGNACFLLGREEDALTHYYKAVERKSHYSLAYLNMACIHERRRAFKEAKRCLGRFGELSPDDPRVVVRQVGLLIAQEQGAQAVDVSLGAIARWGETQDLMLNLGGAQIVAADLDSAEGTLTRVADQWPGAAAAWINLGVIAHRRGHTDHARLLLERAIEIDAGAAEAHHNLGVLLHHEGRHAEAAAAFERAIAADVGMRESHLLRAQCLVELSRAAEAVPVLRKLLAIDPSYLPAYQALGLALEKTGHLAGALETYKDLAKQSDEFTGVLELIMSMWSVHRARGDTERALKALEGAVMLDSRSLVTRLAVAVTYHESNQPSLARKAYDKVLALDPDMARGHLDLGVFMFDVEGDHDAGIRAARKAVELDPQMATAHFDLGIMLAQIEREDDAADSIEHALDLAPDSAEAALALALLRPGQDGGLALFERAVHLAPESFLGWINLGAARYARGDLDGALVAFERARAINPAQAVLHFNIGVVHQDKGDLTPASQAYSRALEIAADADTYFNIALLAQQSDQPHRARTIVQKALARFPSDVPLKVVLAANLVDEGAIELALATLEEAFRDAPEDPTVCLNLAVLLTGKRDLAHARDVLNIGLRHGRWPELVEALGIVQSRAGQLDEAITLLMEAANAMPGRRETALALGIAMLAAGRAPEALALAEEVVSGDPTLMPGRLFYGVALRAAGRWDEELQEYEAAAQCDGSHPGPIINKALVLRERGDLAGALQLLIPLLEARPFDSHLHRLAGELLWKLGRTAQAAEQFCQALDADGRDHVLRTNAALALHKLGRSTEALALLAFASQAPYLPLHLLMAEVCRSLGEPGEAEALDRALAMDEGCVQARIGAASRAIEMGQPSRALALLDHPSVDDLASAHFLTGLAREASDDLPGALGAYHDAVRAGEPSAWLNIGLIERVQGRHREEMLAYRRAIAAGVPQSDVGPLIAQAQLLRGHPRRALATLEALGGTLDLDSLALLGTLRLSLGLFAESLEYLQKASCANPDDADLAYNLALALLQIGDAPAATLLVARRRVVEPSDHFIQGLALEIAGDRVGAAGCYAAGLEQFPDALELRLAAINLNSATVGREAWPTVAKAYATLIDTWGEGAPSFLFANLRHVMAGSPPLEALLGHLPADLFRAVRAARARPCLSNRELARRLPEALGPRFPSRWFLAMPLASHPPANRSAQPVESRPVLDRAGPGD